MTTATTDPLLHAWLLAIATEPPESWYADSRLALADWLEERGDGRAEAVRDDVAVREFRERVATILLREREAGHLSKWLFRVALEENCRTPMEWTPESTSRERQRLLSLFPEVTLTGPCPRHEPLPEGVRVAVLPRADSLFTVPVGWCLSCGGGPRVRPAPEFPDGGDVYVVGVGELFQSGPSFFGKSRGSFMVDNQSAHPVRVPADMMLPTTDLLGNPL